MGNLCAKVLIMLKNYWNKNVDIFGSAASILILCTLTVRHEFDSESDESYFTTKEKVQLM